MASSIAPAKAKKTSAGKPNRAVLKDALPCCANQARAVAPRGEYEIEEVESPGAVSTVGLCSCATQNRFTLSYDAFAQHLNEGRIAVLRR
jgi:hypothetical protein